MVFSVEMTGVFYIFIFALTLSGCSPSKIGDARHETNGRAKVEHSGILQGNQPSSGALASTVAIYDTRTTELCSGVIIGKNTVLTAAHCLTEDFSTSIVIFGKRIRKGESTARKIMAVHIPEQRPVTRFQDVDTADLAVVTFQGPLPLTHSPAMLVKSDREFIHSNTLSLAGFGLTNGSKQTGAGHLLETEIKLESRLGKNEFLINQSLGKGVCHGDSGGPGFVRLGGEVKVWGIVSRGYNDQDGTCNAHSVITNITPYIDWIDSKMDLQ